MSSGPGAGSSAEWEATMVAKLRAKYGGVRESRVAALQSEAEVEFR